MSVADPVPAPRSAAAPGWAVLLIAVTALAIATATLALTLVGGPSLRFGAGMMSGGNGMMSGGGGMMSGGAGMMGGGAAMMGGSQDATEPRPGAASFVAGTTAAPRIVRVIAGPGLVFHPATVSVVSGETVTFLVTTMGPTAHEFMVGPADAVAADAPGTPEIAEIGMMETKALTFTFDGPGPFAFACHAAGHYEAGMRGTITVLPE